jgi:hypothetical protein
LGAGAERDGTEVTPFVTCLLGSRGGNLKYGENKTMKKILETILIYAAVLLALGVANANAKEPKHADFPETFRVLSVQRVQEAVEGSTYWVYEYHVAQGTQGYTLRWFYRPSAYWRPKNNVPLQKGITYFARPALHNHGFEVITVNDKGKEVTETFSIISVD